MIPKPDSVECGGYRPIPGPDEGELCQHIMTKYPLVLIKWRDSHQVSGWHTDEPATMPLMCSSVGWLIYDGEEAKTLAPHMTDEETPQRSGEMTIPACAVVTMKVLR